MKEIVLPRIPVNQKLGAHELRGWPWYPEWGHYHASYVKSYADHYYVTQYDDLFVALNIEEYRDTHTVNISVRVYNSEGVRTGIGGDSDGKGFITAHGVQYCLDDAAVRRDWVLENLPAYLILRSF